MGLNGHDRTGGGEYPSLPTSHTNSDRDSASRPAPGLFVSQLERDTDLPYDPYQGRTPEQWQRNEDIAVWCVGMGVAFVALTVLVYTIRAILVYTIRAILG